MDVVELLGRLLFAYLFFRNGLNHLKNREMMIGVGRAVGAPSPNITVPLAGVVMVVASILIALGVWADAAALALVFFLPFAGFLAHAYWKETDPMVKAAQDAQFWKNIALTGAALFLLAYFSRYGDEFDLTLGSGLF